MHGGSLGDSLEDAAVSYLVSVQILVITSSAVDWSDRVELDFLRLPQKSTIYVYSEITNSLLGTICFS